MDLPAHEQDIVDIVICYVITSDSWEKKGTYTTS